MVESNRGLEMEFNTYVSYWVIGCFIERACLFAAKKCFNESLKNTEDLNYTAPPYVEGDWGWESF